MNAAFLERLERVHTVISHGGACPDGIASAMIIMDALPGVNVKFLNYNTQELNQLKAEPGLLFVDFTPPESRVNEFVEAGTVVLDHHEKQKHLVEAFGEFGIYTDKPGWSGAMLAYAHVWEPIKQKQKQTLELFHDQDSRVSYFAKLAGIRDTWQKDSFKWRQACAQAEALRFYPFESWFKPRLYWADVNQKIDAIGEVLLQKSENDVLRLAEKAHYYQSFKGTRVAILPSVQTSDVTEKLDSDFLIGFAYDAEGEEGEKISLRLSMRSRKGYDVGLFCKSLNGGGHKFAAGATLPVVGGHSNPYDVIKKLVDDYERGVSQ